MKVHFDEEADAVFLHLDEKNKVVESQEVEEGVILDFDAKGEVIGVEILNVKDRVGLDQLKQLSFKIAN